MTVNKKKSNTWRASLFVRSLFLALGIFLLVVGVSPWSDEDSYFSDTGTRLSEIAVSISLAYFPQRPRVIMSDTDLRIRGFVRERRLVLTDIVKVESTYGGLHIVLSNGRSFVVPLVAERSNIGLVLGISPRSSAERAIRNATYGPPRHLKKGDE